MLLFSTMDGIPIYDTYQLKSPIYKIPCQFVHKMRNFSNFEKKTTTFSEKIRLFCERGLLIKQPTCKTV